jgi:hypothetical protein
MHLDPHTVYHHVPLFKEDNYTHADMDLLNETAMMQQNLHNRDQDVEPEERARRATLTEQEKNRALGDPALTQILCFEGVTAYRRRGWERGSSDINDPVYEEAEYKDMGIRARVLTQGLVYCRWGRARGMQSAAAMDDEEGKRVHGDAWREGGFVNFTHVEGVFDWLGKDRAEKKERRRNVVESMVEKVGAGKATAAAEEEEEIVQDEGPKKRNGIGKARRPSVDSDPDR